MNRQRHFAPSILGAIGISAALAVYFIAVLAAADRITSMPALCGVCHEVEPKVTAWKRSAHAAVGCKSCHSTPQALHVWPWVIRTRGQRAWLELYERATGVPAGPEQAGSERRGAVPDAACGKCHKLGRTATRDGIRIDHAKHARRNMSCISCHQRTAHPDPSRQRGSLMMSDCYGCHGLSPKSKAPGQCNICHTKEFGLRPASHRSKTWLTPEHGQTAKVDKRPCGMCHTAGMCRDCHGLDLPHPSIGWKRGTSGHAAVGARDPKVCARCHSHGPDTCSGCHHWRGGYDPKKGTWVAQHRLVVRDVGSSACFLSCHDPMYCANCHLTGRK